MKAAKTFWREEQTPHWATISVPFMTSQRADFLKRAFTSVTLDVVMKTGQSLMRLIFAPLAETDSQQYEAAAWPNIAAAGRSGEGKVSMFHLSEPSAPATATQLHQTLLHSVSWRGL